MGNNNLFLGSVRAGVLNNEVIKMTGSRIFKYTIPVQDKTELKLPVGSQILSVAEQNEEIVVYALTTSNTATRKVTILVIGTGNPITENISEYTFLGTVKLLHGALMFHVFYKGCE
jgi:hypothetical protein